jgi:hypothetical protein
LSENGVAVYQLRAPLRISSSIVALPVDTSSSCSGRATGNGNVGSTSTRTPATVMNRASCTLGRGSPTVPPVPMPTEPLGSGSTVA